MSLGNTLSNPHNVPALLLLQLDVGIEHTEMKLIQEGQLIEFHLQTHNPHFKQSRLLTSKTSLDYDFQCSNIVNSKALLTSCSKKRSSRVLSPGLLPAPSKRSLYSWSNMNSILILTSFWWPIIPETHTMWTSHQNNSEGTVHPKRTFCHLIKS